MMPFLPLNFDLLTKAEKDILRAFVEKDGKPVMLLSSSQRKPYGLAKVPNWENLIPTAVQRIKNGCKLDCGLDIFHIGPNVQIPKHTDWKKRQCTIISQLSVVHTPTRFWKDTKDLSPFAVLKTKDLPALIDTQVLHDVSRTPIQRFNFQVYFHDITFAEVSNLLNRNDLFDEDAKIYDSVLAQQ